MFKRIAAPRSPSSSTAGRTLSSPLFTSKLSFDSVSESRFEDFIQYISDMVAGLKTVILLSFVLAVGFLLVILSCALFANWLPLLVALTFVIAPLPNAIFAHCGGADDFSSSESEGSAAVDLGRFLTSIIVVTGFALPLVLAHAEVIRHTAALMSIVGGGLVYGTILSYSQVFKQEEDEF
ncbi:Vacuolar protein sorting-associated protein 55 [Tulasnella sp. 424]|nr:Vacuolar protein sorting-associated protein 55 [Tulasnella sp. 424]KAG8978385.1 Vacuolar protein sorting-associated protein 55 [Tulasnella sp. 425]